MKGVRLSIDDFGTGYSSLAQLRDVPFDELKIDRSFVHRAAQDSSLRVILEASLAMARQLGLKTVAEGIEERADWDLLRAAGCDMAQGYFRRQADGRRGSRGLDSRLAGKACATHSAKAKPEFYIIGIPSAETRAKRAPHTAFSCLVVACSAMT